MKDTLHRRIETLAGAIALSEATDAERHEYREHIARCPRCLHDLGGEHEIERTANVVTSARESEQWQPELQPGISRKLKRPPRAFTYGGAAAAAVFVAVAAFSAWHPQSGQSHARISIASSPAAARLLVFHNVVQIARAPLTLAATSAPAGKHVKPRELESVIVHAPAARRANAKKNGAPAGTAFQWQPVSQTTTTAVSESAPEGRTVSAESLRIMAPVVREAAPIGGETAINPQPPMIAYDIGAEGTSVFEVLVDERGIPTKCVITKPAGYPVLDQTVCKAAMKARYTPKTVDGKPVAGVYRDAFTFRMSDSDRIEIPFYQQPSREKPTV